MKTFWPVEKDFYQRNKVSLEEAVDKYNKRKKENVDVNFLLSMYEQDEFRDVALQQLEDIQSSLNEVLATRDDLTDRLISKALKELDKTKKERDDTRIAKKVLNKELLITRILESDYKFNPLIQLNQSSLNKESYSTIWEFNRWFTVENKWHVILEYYTSSNCVKDIKIIAWHEDNIILTRDMIKDIDLKQYPFLLRWNYQHGIFI